MATTRCPLAVFVVVTVLAVGCANKGNTGAASSGTEGAGATGGAPAEAALTPAQLENGIGPVTQLTLPPTIDAKLAAAGEETFKTKCSACHHFDQRYVGPALGEVTKRRTPAYVMNMILNPTEMTQRHPAARQLLTTLMTQMPNLGLTQEQARAVLEYLRKSAQPETGGKS